MDHPNLTVLTMDFGKRLATLRRERGLTQPALAEHIAIHVSHHHPDSNPTSTPSTNYPPTNNKPSDNSSKAHYSATKPTKSPTQAKHAYLLSLDSYQFKRPTSGGDPIAHRRRETHRIALEPVLVIASTLKSCELDTLNFDRTPARKLRATPRRIEALQHSAAYVFARRTTV
jgi:hypothetical protein